jgi:hypothetical protein
VKPPVWKGRGAGRARRNPETPGAWSRGVGPFRGPPMDSFSQLLSRAEPGEPPDTRAEVERLRAEVERLRAEVEALKHGPGGGPPACQLVTLSQAAAMVSRSKNTLRKVRHLMPPPREPGGNGFATRWDWQDMRPWLEDYYGVNLERYRYYFPGTPQGQGG